MDEIIAIGNQKGGVGKSTSVGAIGACLFSKGYKVLYIDLDSQGNLSYTLRTNNQPTRSTLLDVLIGKVSLEEILISTPQGDLIPSTPLLSCLESRVNDTGKEYRLKEVLIPLRAKYDFILLDTPPSLGLLTINALTACDSIIVPAQPDIYSLQGIGQLMQTISAVKQRANSKLFIRGLLLTRYSVRAVLSRGITELLQDTADKFSTRLYRTKIRECIALKEAQAKHMDILAYAPKSNAAEDYTKLTNEILEQITN